MWLFSGHAYLSPLQQVNEWNYSNHGITVHNAYHVQNTTFMNKTYLKYSVFVFFLPPQMSPYLAPQKLCKRLPTAVVQQRFTCKIHSRNARSMSTEQIQNSITIRGESNEKEKILNAKILHVATNLLTNFCMLYIGFHNFSHITESS